MKATDYNSILKQIDGVDPVAYGRSRNYRDGAVTRLSPYISRGVISTKQVMENMLGRGFALPSIEKFIQELAWRDYWQHVWISKGDAINQDLRHPQPETENHQIPQAIVSAQTGIEAIDEGIKELYDTGYVHNHMRMYLAALACNVAKSHWREPARWMYYYLLDADWASNALSWQWVAGSNANKKYVANQENINKYFFTSQKATYLDIPYSELPTMDVPEALRETQKLVLRTELPTSDELNIDEALPTLLYNYYNLDPNWYGKDDSNRILLLEPSIFEQYPVSKNSIDFALNLAKNITGIQVFVGEFDDLKNKIGLSKVIFKEHPLNRNYQGKEEPREWMFSVTGYYPSFFAFWKKCKKEMKLW